MFRDKLKELTKGSEEGEGNNKKKIENLVFFVVLLIVTIVIINLIWNGNKQATKQENNTSSKQLAKLENNVAKATATRRNSRHRWEFSGAIRKYFNKNARCRGS